MNRRNQILSLVLAFQMVLVAFIFWPRSTPSGSSTGTLLEEFRPENATALTIDASDGSSISLALVEGRWVLPEADNYPVKASAVDDFLTKLAEIGTDRLVTSTSASHDRLKVAGDNFERRIELDTTLEGYTIYLGTSPSYGVNHIRLFGHEATYLTSDLSTVNARTNVSAWIDTSYFNVPTSEILAFTVSNSQGEFSFEKDRDGNWTLADLLPEEQVDSEGIAALITKITSVTMVRPLGLQELAAYGMDQPSAVATIQTSDGSKTLTVGAQDPDDLSYVVKSSEADYYVAVSNFSVSELIERGRQDFIVLTPAPTEEGGP